MAGGPLPVWRGVERHPSDGTPPPTTLDGSGLQWFAILYRRCALTHGWTPAQVNVCEVWEVAAALGSATAELEQWEQDRPPSTQPDLHSGRDFVAERVIAAREGRKVEAPVMSPASVMVLQEAVSGR